MAHYRAPASKSLPQTLQNELVMAVGWHAFVNWPRRADERAEAVPLANGTSEDTKNDLSDGQEVELLAWRPFASGGLAYRIKRISDGNEFWVRALYLRRSA